MRTVIALFLLAGTLVGAPPPQANRMLNALSPGEQAEGWRLLFDGKTTNGWRGYRQPSLPDGWKALDGALTRVGTAIDIVTVAEFGDFELTIDWNLSAGGNSGILYRVTETEDVSWK